MARTRETRGRAGSSCYDTTTLNAPHPTRLSRVPCDPCSLARRSNAALEIYVLLLNRRRPFYYGEPLAAVKPASSDAGWRAQIEARWTSWQNRLRSAEGAAGNLLRRVESFLRRFESPDEPMLRALRWTPELSIVHPEHLSCEQVRRGWNTELRRQTRKHAVWLLANSLVSPITLFLALLPGPNLIGYWFVYRAGAHAMALVGVWRARRGVIPTTFRADPILDQPLRTKRRIDRDALDALTRHCGLNGLHGFLERRGWLRDTNPVPDPADLTSRPPTA